MDQQERERRYKIIKEARETVERLDATAHEWRREPSDEDIIEQPELRQRSEGDLVYKTCERAAEPQPAAWQEWLEQRLAQEREHIITLLGEVIGASWRRQSFPNCAPLWPPSVAARYLISRSRKRRAN